MPDTLQDIVENVYSRLGDLHSGEVDSGTTTTTVDATLGGRQDDWKNGVLFIDYDAGGAAAAPEGQWEAVSGYAQATGTLTHATLTAAPAAGDLYSLASARIPLAIVISMVNQRLKAKGDIPAIDTSLAFATSQSIYTLPAAARGGRLRQVWEATLSDTDDPGLTAREDWAPYGTTQIEFKGGIVSGNTIHLVYIGQHARMGAYGDALSPFLHIDLVTSDVAYWLARTHLAKGRGTSRELKDQLASLREEWEMAKRDHRIVKPAKQHRALLSPDDLDGRSNKYGPWI